MKFKAMTISFQFRGKRYFETVLKSELPYLDDNDDWWDHWFSDSRDSEQAKFDFQLCGDIDEDGNPIEDGALVIYVYNHGEYDDELRIDTINEIDICDISDTECPIRDKAFITHCLRKVLTSFMDASDAEEIIDAVIDDVISDIQDTADSQHWHDGDVNIAFARVLKQRITEHCKQ